jgi:hypothetical protein
VPSENNYTVAVDPEGTAKYGHQVVQHAGDLRTQRTAWLQSTEQQVHQLGPWADEFKSQMINGTLPAAHAAGERVARGWEDHGHTAIKHSQVMPEVDASHATKLNGIENT